MTRPKKTTKKVAKKMATKEDLTKVYAFIETMSMSSSSFRDLLFKIREIEKEIGGPHILDECAKFWIEYLMEAESIPDKMTTPLNKPIEIPVGILDDAIAQLRQG